MTFFQVILLAIILLVPDTAKAIQIYNSEDISLDLSGYYKNLSFTSREAETDNWYVANLNRLRTEWDGRIGWVSAKIIWDNEFIGGDYVRTAEFNDRQAVRASPFFDLEYEISQKRSLFYGQAIYRAYLKLEPGPFVLTMGRQKIDWGVARFFSPGDIFTPLSLFDVEDEEKTGSDAVNLLIPLDKGAKANFVYTLGGNFDKSRTGLRLTKALGRFDVSLSGGRFQEDFVFGADFSGDVASAGLRGEVFYNISQEGRNFVQGSIGIDYGFPNTLYLAGEYFLNGQAENKENPDLLKTTLSAQPIKTQYRDFAISKIKYDFTPLWTGQLTTIWDLKGSSLFISPETVYSMFSWMDVKAGALLPTGHAAGEFTENPSLYFLQTQLFF